MMPRPEIQGQQGQQPWVSTYQQASNAASDFDLCIFKSDLYNVTSYSLKMMLEGCSQYHRLNTWQTCSICT